MNNIAYPLKNVKETRKPFLQDIDPEVLEYIQHFLDIKYDEVNVLKTSTSFNIEALSGFLSSNLVNLKRVNDISRINRFFEIVNAHLKHDGIYIGFFESKEQRKSRIFKKMPSLIGYPFYLVDFIWKRIFPKVNITKKIYFGLTDGRNRVISLPEMLGRLISCGFDIIDYTEINNLTYFAIKKTGTPEFDNNPTYGPLISLDRVGRGGKMKKVYKIRTMHPFAEYLQEYIYEQNSLKKGGKFKDDFRITHWGSLLRKFWLDELPMIYNWLKGELKLVGVRPLSKHYFQLYPDEFKKRRINYKPGLIPPFYVDLPITFDEIVESEKRYLDRYDKNPFKTDIIYFYKSLYNILIKRARSK